MCGVFGFITTNGSGPDLARLRRIAAQTQQRGHHAFGLAWIDAQGGIHTFKRPGPATDFLKFPRRLAGGGIHVCKLVSHWRT